MTSTTSNSRTDGQHRRAEVIAGLRQLAGWLEANPAVPVPGYGWDLSVHPRAGSHDDQRGRAEIGRIAALMGVTAVSSDHHGDDYAATRRFGPVTYRAMYITARRMAAHNALMTYTGTITPDDVPGAA